MAVLEKKLNNEDTDIVEESKQEMKYKNIIGDKTNEELRADMKIMNDKMDQLISMMISNKSSKKSLDSPKQSSY
jgi:hypothetical protein